MAYHLAKENFPTLIGESVEHETIEGIKKIMLANPFIKDVKDIKAVSIGSNKFRFKVEITYDLKV